MLSLVLPLLCDATNFLCIHTLYIHIDTASATGVREVPSLSDNLYIPTNLAPLHSSQLHIVIAAYDTAIKKISAAGPVKKELAAQAMHELGDILLHSGNTRCVYMIIHNCGQR